MKFEMHAHTSENDPCAKVGAAEIVKMYKAAGYAGIIITDHYFNRFFDRPEFQGKTHSELIDCYLKGYRTAKEAGEKAGVTVLLGIELRFNNCINDYLVYGLDEAFLKKAPLLNRLNLDAFLKIKPESALIYQAHPFRDGMMITNPDKLFGIEVRNGATPPERNRIADAWADTFRLHKISGSDFHSKIHLAKSGLDFFDEIANSDSLVKALRTDNYDIL